MENNLEKKAANIIHRNNLKFKFLHRNGKPVLSPGVSGEPSLVTTFQMVTERKALYFSKHK